MSEDSGVLVVGFPGAVARLVALAVVAAGRRVLLLCPPGARHAGRELAARSGGRLALVEGAVERIDFGLAGERYMALAEEIDAILLVATPPAPGSGDPPTARTAAREVIELGLVAPRLRQLLVLSHLDVAGHHAGSFAEHDLELGQRFKEPEPEDRFRAERTVRRFARELPVTVVRSGWIVGRADDQLCPLVELLLAGADEALREEGRVPLTELEALVGDIVGLLEQRPPVGGRFLHLCGAPAPHPLELARRVRQLAAELVPTGLDLHAGARRALARGGRRWTPKRFFKHQARATRIESAYSREFLARLGLPLPELTEEQLAALVEHAVEQIAGFR